MALPLSPCLILSNSNVIDTSLNCDALGIHYQVSFQKLHAGLFNMRKLVTFTKSVAEQPQVRTLVAEWDLNLTGTDLIKIPDMTGDTFREMETIFPKQRRFLTFYGPSGKLYKWKLAGKMELHCEHPEGGTQLVATFHQRHILFGQRNAYIELNSGYEDILDLIVVVFTIAHRIRERRSAAAAAAGAGAS